MEDDDELPHGSGDPRQILLRQVRLRYRILAGLSADRAETYNDDDAAQNEPSQRSGRLGAAIRPASALECTNSALGA